MSLLRSDLRAQLQRMTSGQLTDSGDQDLYLNQAELEVISDWRRFDPGLFRPGKQTGTTSSVGILKLEALFAGLERMEDGSQNEYIKMRGPQDIQNVLRGYLVEGFDETTYQRTVKVFESGTPLNAGTVYYYPVVNEVMASGASGISPLPEEYRTLIAMRASHLYYRDQGPPFASFKEMWRQEYENLMAKAETWYRNLAKSETYAESDDPDAGGHASIRMIH